MEDSAALARKRRRERILNGAELRLARIRDSPSDSTKNSCQHEPVVLPDYNLTQLEDNIPRETSQTADFNNEVLTRDVINVPSKKTFDSFYLVFPAAILTFVALKIHYGDLFLQSAVIPWLVIELTDWLLNPPEKTQVIFLYCIGILSKLKKSSTNLSCYYFIIILLHVFFNEKQ